MIGQVLALDHPGRLSSLVLCDSTGRGAPNAAAMWADRARVAREQGMAALVTGTLSRWLTEPFRALHPEAVESLAAAMRSTDAQGYGACCSAIAALDTLDQLHTLDVPALVLVGAHDEATPPQMSRDLQAHLPGAELAVIEGAAHISSVEQADEFNRRVLDFLLRQA
jgi:3-oxoadipate enol-lactonase